MTENKSSGPSGPSPRSLRQTARNRTRVYVSQMGCITPAGAGPDPLWRSAWEERSTLATTDGLGRVTDESLTDAISGRRELPYYLEMERLLDKLPESRWLLFALYAISNALRASDRRKLGPGDGLILGTTTGSILSWEGAAIARGTGTITADEIALAFRKEPLGLALRELCEHLGFQGPARLVGSACSASTHALALGAVWIRQGKVKRCLAGGAEVLCRLTIEGFRSLQLLSPSVSRPFDEGRTGINLSEGAAFFCLESEAGPEALAELSGFGMSSDAYHVTAPHPEGRGCYRAMSAALDTAGLSPEDISWIHAHGTGSLANDRSEAAAIVQLFGKGPSAPWVSSTKPVHGHALGASGALESVISVKALGMGKVPATAGLKKPEPGLFLRHPSRGQATPLQNVLKNSLGFGGANASLIFSNLESDS